MVLLTLEDGKKGPGDTVIRIRAYEEKLTLETIFRILKIIFESEDNCYPISKGNDGRCYLMKAILEVYSDISIEHILVKYGLKRKGKSLTIIDKRKHTSSSQILNGESNLAEILEF